MNLHDENGKLVNFCVPLTGSDEEKRAIAIEVIDKSVEMGAVLHDGVEFTNNHARFNMKPSQWRFVGVDSDGSFETRFRDKVERYGPRTKQLTLNEFRDYYDEWKSEQWPDDDSPRNQAIHQNGNTAEHYPNKYQRQIKPGVWVDVYDVLDAFKVECPALQHLTKKALAAGSRGHKDTITDLKDIIASAERALQLELQRNEMEK